MNKSERIFKIEQLVTARRLVSFRDLLDELQVSRATLKRDLEQLRSRIKTPIVYDREELRDQLPVTSVSPASEFIDDLRNSRNDG